MYVSVEAFTF